MGWIGFAFQCLMQVTRLASDEAQRSHYEADTINILKLCSTQVDHHGKLSREFCPSRKQLQIAG